MEPLFDLHKKKISLRFARLRPKSSPPHPPVFRGGQTQSKGWGSEGWEPKPRKGGAPKGGAPKGGGPKIGHGQLWPNRLWPTEFGQPFVVVCCVFCCVVVLLLLWCLDLPLDRPSPGPPFPGTALPRDRLWGCRGFTRQPENSKRAHMSTREDTQRGKKRTNFAVGEGKKKKREIWASHPSGPHFWAPPFGPPLFLGLAPTLPTLRTPHFLGPWGHPSPPTHDNSTHTKKT